MRNRIVALCITFFAGFLGLHKFYLGENFAGIMYFLFSWTFIPGLFSVFDFLGLALMSEETFNRKFNSVTKPYTIPEIKIPEIPQNLVNSLRQKSSREAAATLTELKKLYDNGIITAEEYEAKRRKLLDSI